MAVISASPAVISSPLSALRRRAHGVLDEGTGLTSALRLAVAVAAVFLAGLAASTILMRPALSVPPAPMRASAPVIAESVAYPAWTVQPGDTLWSIAVAARPTADPRAVVLQLRVVNDLPPSHVLQVGEVLQVPSS